MHYRCLLLLALRRREPSTQLLLLLLLDELSILLLLMRLCLPLLLLGLPLFETAFLNHVAHSEILLPVPLLHLVDLALLLDLDGSHDLFVVHVSLLVILSRRRTSTATYSTTTIYRRGRRCLLRRRLWQLWRLWQWSWLRRRHDGHRLRGRHCLRLAESLCCWWPTSTGTGT